ncbi:alpha/beta hydrolase family esterase [Aestuariivivens sediminis]|uniref:alpha/beta hydrolase family esterase n=1 Tax=Aestuariivivens sediminis TaxID=2913557 RepID=UPI001F59A8D1|nr:PHB depolymerase family esterase [Aestuariivivens sediminis]
MVSFRKHICFITGLIIGCTSVMAQIEETLVHDNYTRHWITYLPKHYNKDRQYPLVISLHGGGGQASQLMKNTRHRFNKLADEEGFIVVYPNGLKKSWNDNNKRDTHGFARKENIDDVGFIEKMIAHLEASYPIHPKAIFACGISNGGLMSQTLAMALPHKIRAIGMVASNFGRDQIETSKEMTPFSVLFIHGTADPIFPYAEGDIQVFNTTRGHVLGIEKSLAYINARNGNDVNPVKTPIANTVLKDNCTSEHLKYLNPEHPNLKVELIKIHNGGHTWPGAKTKRVLSKIVGPTTQDFNACDKLWAFFKSTLD